ncbi:hypothetical protein BGP_2041 [Beggiatoa sp. PS]|nr:hypothetical protein BGP_2041 [Beggiatoa sp. PS]
MALSLIPSFTVEELPQEGWGEGILVGNKKMLSILHIHIKWRSYPLDKLTNRTSKTGMSKL